jgi:hypothetical protein
MWLWVLCSAEFVLLELIFQQQFIIMQYFFIDFVLINIDMKWVRMQSMC